MLLWRGAEVASPSARSYATRSPQPDLLDEQTYGPAGAAFFAEMQLAHLPVRPASAHIATGDPAVAAEWGRPVSVWPLGEFEYAFWEAGSLIYDNDASWEDAVRQRGPMVVGRGLRGAMEAGKEVMFCTGAFVEIGGLLLPSVLGELERATYSGAS